MNTLKYMLRFMGVVIISSDFAVLIAERSTP